MSGKPLRHYLSLPFVLGKVRERGVIWCLKTGICYFFVGFIRWIITCLVKCQITPYLLHLMNVRFLTINVSFVGHLAHDTECYIKEGILGMRPNHFGILLAPNGSVANPHLLGYWRRYVRIINSSLLCHLLRPLSQEKRLVYDTWYYTDKANRIRSFPLVQRSWGNRPPLLVLSEADRKRGWDCLRSLGLPEDAWFVCVHCREPGYVYPNYSPEYSAVYHKTVGHRNGDIFSYLPSMEMITKRGGWCIRMGAPSTKSLPPMEKVIDYAHLPLRSDWMDVFLCASCRFFLAGSGIAMVANVFGVPVSRTNVADMEAILIHGPCDVNIPKLVRDSNEQRLLTFKEVFDSPISSFTNASQYEKAAIRMVDNTPEEIGGLVLEMLERTAGTLTYSAEDERLQEQFKSLMRPDHLSYGSSARIGRDFLRKYAYLLPGAGISG